MDIAYDISLNQNMQIFFRTTFQELDLNQKICPTPLGYSKCSKGAKSQGHTAFFPKCGSSNWAVVARVSNPKCGSYVL